MTATTIDYAATLSALAAHIEKHDLGRDITTIQFDDVNWVGLKMQVHTAEMVSAWVRSLDNVSATAFWHGASVHVRITAWMDGVPLRLLFIATMDGERSLIAEFRGTLLDADSGLNGGVPIELPEVLGGTR